MAFKKFLLTFTPDLVNEPITYTIVKDFDLKFNILRAVVDDHGGQLLIGLEGPIQQIEKAVGYLQEARVNVKELNEYIRRDEERCTNCGMCVSICPVGAYQVDRKTHKILFLNEKCIACGMCIDACPLTAIRLRATA
jgi:ferredoxin